MKERAGRSAAVCLCALLLVIGFVPSMLGQEEGRIMRPVDGSALPPGEVSVVATAPGGALEIDGTPIAAEEPFPNVFHAKLSPPSGPHTLALIWEGGRQEVRFFVGDKAPEDFKAFKIHPPLAVECTQCHGLSRRGRFRFKGGCFDCHQQDQFTKAHPHPSHMLEECGMCHNAHGSTAKAHMMLPRELACKQCHN